MEAVFHFEFVLVDKNALTLGFVVVLVEKMCVLNGFCTCICCGFCISVGFCQMINSLYYMVYVLFFLFC